MSTSRFQRARGDEGFTLIEVMVAMALLGLVMTAALPALIAMLRSTASVKLDTQAKNLTQERLEQMRDLRYHVDRQNGPFLDVLDIYYTNATSPAVTTSITVGGTSLSGSYVVSGAAANGEPAAPFYRVTAATINGMPSFSQTIDTQFLTPTGAALPATAFQNTYDSQVIGRDAPPSLVVGVTVITKWVDGGRQRTLRTYTRLTDGRAAAPVIQTQARARAVDITSTAADGSTLDLQAGVANGDGAQSSGSTASGFAAGALATQSGNPVASGLTGQFSLPQQSPASSGNSSPQAGSSCSWYGFGRTATTDVTGTIASGLPKVPSDTDTTTPATTMTAYIQDNSGGGCGLLAFSNLTGGGIARAATDPVGYEMGSAPYVSAPDLAGGSAPALSGGVYLSSNALTSVPQKSVAGASAAVTRQVVLFPGNPESGGRGLVSVTMSQASVDCASDGSVVGKYSVTIGWWGRGPADTAARWHSASWTYNSGSASSPVLTAGSDAWNPGGTVLGNGTTLAQLVSTTLTSNGPAVLGTGGTSGLSGFTDGVLSLSTASTLTNEVGAGFSAIKVQVGKVTCVASDAR